MWMLINVAAMLFILSPQAAAQSVIVRLIGKALMRGSDDVARSTLPIVKRTISVLDLPADRGLLDCSIQALGANRLR